MEVVYDSYKAVVSYNDTYGNLMFDWCPLRVVYRDDEYVIEILCFEKWHQFNSYTTIKQVDDYLIRAQPVYSKIEPKRVIKKIGWK